MIMHAAALKRYFDEATSFTFQGWTPVGVSLICLLRLLSAELLLQYTR